MIKQNIIYFLSFVLLSLLGYCSHTSFLPSIASDSPMSVVGLYLFFTIFSFLLCTSLTYLQKTKKFREQLGFLYLFSVGLKIIIFCILFYSAIFSKESFTNRQSINLLIPMILMLILEVFFVCKLLNRFNPVKNE